MSLKKESSSANPEDNSTVSAVEPYTFTSPIQATGNESDFDYDSEFAVQINIPGCSNRGASQNRKRKIFPKKASTSKKRIRNPENWKRKIAASSREKGLAYTSYSGKEVPEKTPNYGMLCNDKCPFKCNERFDAEQRKKIFTDFYQMDVNAKNAFLFNCISLVPLQRMRKNAVKHKTHSYRYNVKNEEDSVRVCKSALASLFQVGRGKINYIQESIKLGLSVPAPDCRGKHMNRPHKASPEDEYILPC